MSYYTNSDSGILLVSPGLLEVSFFRSINYRMQFSKTGSENYKKTFAKHGFMEAVQVPYKLEPFGLVVICASKEAEAAGWMIANTIDGIPF